MKWFSIVRSLAVLVAPVLAVVGSASAQDAVVMVKDIAPGLASSAPSLTTAVGGLVFFKADDGVNGAELWKSDGTTAGTSLVKDIRVGPGGSLASLLTPFDGRLFFKADDGRGGELWASDGTEAGTVLVKDISASGGSVLDELTRVGSLLMFRANDGINGAELWKTDGTTAGTVLVKDVRPGADGSDLSDLVNVENTLFFLADSDGVNGRELWKSTGTAGGTGLVKDVQAPATAGRMAALGGTLFFRNSDAAAGMELWKSDGTAAGTGLLKDLRPGTESSSPTGLIAMGGTLFFIADGGNGDALWRSDGTPGGTVEIKDPNPAGPGGTIGPLTVLGSTLFFPASSDGFGTELWKSDGTPGGTVRVKDIAPGSQGSNPASLTNVGGTLYFRANDRVSGAELWKSDGTEAGTVLVADIYPGVENASIDDLAAFGTRLIFGADDGVNGRELWRLGPSGPPVLATDPPPLTVGASNTLLGGDFSPGTVVKLFVGTGAGVLDFGPYSLTGRTPSSITFEVPPDVPLGNGVVAIQVVKTDQGFLASNVVGTLLFGDPADNIPTIRNVNGQWLGPGLLSYAVAFAEVVVTAGSTVTIGGSGFNNALVNVFTAAGNVGPLVPLAGATSSQIQVTLPPGAPTGPGNFQVVNNPYTGNTQSQVVATVINARPSITSVVQSGGTITVNGTGFSTVSVINLFNLQGGGVVNLGGFAPGGIPNVPLTFVNENQFTFTRPSGAVAGPAFIEVLNPPFIPFTASGSDPDGAFDFTGPAPFITTGLPWPVTGAPTREAMEPAGAAARATRPSALREAGELVVWADAVWAAADGSVLESRAAPPWRAGARSTRVLMDGDGFVEWPVGRRAVAVGLSHGDTDGSLADIDFALRVDPATGELTAVERGRVVGAFGTAAEGDVLRVGVRHGLVEYFRNGGLLVTSAVAPRYPLLVDTSLGGAGAALEGVRLGGRLGTAVEWPAPRDVAVAGTRVTAARPAALRAAAGDATVVEAVLSRGAGTGFGSRGCDYCVVRTGEVLEVRHAGTVRGTFKADVSARVRVELDGDIVGYWAGTTRLDEAPISGERPGHVIGLFERARAAIEGAVVAAPAPR
jgi:ELWxxDGT repeat protein